MMDLVGFRTMIVLSNSMEPVINENDLNNALNEKVIFGAGLDVFEKEPATDLSHFAGLNNLIATPHIAGVTSESNDRVSQMIADEVIRFLGERK